MATNYVQDGDVIEVELSGSVSSGDGALIQNQFVIYQNDGESGDTVAALRTGVIEYAKATGTAWDQFQKIYYDESADELTHTDDTSTNSVVGVAAADATSGADKGKLILNASVAE